MTILTISHHIFLTKDQRYALAKGVSIGVVGVSVPVKAKKGVRPKTAEEVFCKYFLNNCRSAENVTASKNGYDIHIPNRKYKRAKLSNEDWRKMTPDQRTAWYAKQKQSKTGKLLLDVKDGGCGGNLNFIYHVGDTLHFVEIKPIETLMDSLV